MNRLLAHRGPDDAGYFFDPERAVGLAHSRLAIIDLDRRSSQPMTDPTGRFVIVFNGEIYNYRQLRSRLVDRGRRFITQSDTEVLLNGYAEHGREFTAQLEGMFAFAIWDRRERELYLARDAFGVKPLYWTETGTGFGFASELKALTALPDLQREINLEAAQEHLSLLYSTAPRTMLQSVQKLEPGNTLIVERGRVRTQRRFYHLPVGEQRFRGSIDEATAAVRSSLEESVAMQMVADVEVGAFLSGGVDSTAICAIASAAHHLNPVRRAFTISAEAGSDSESGFAPDLPFASLAAKRLGLELTEIPGSSAAISELVSEMVWQLDEPTADPAALSAHAIARVASDCGIKVLLSGAGGDDVFSGYRRHIALVHEHWWSWLPAPARAVPGLASQHLAARGAFARRLQRSTMFAGDPDAERLTGYFLWQHPGRTAALLSRETLDALDGRDPRESLLQTLKELPPGVSSLDKMLALELRHFLADHNLNYTDKMTMARGVEARVPFLSRDLVRLAFSLPPSMKVSGLRSKIVLKRAVSDVVPREIIRRPKTGFGGPIRRWLERDLGGLVNDALGPRSVRNRGVYNAAAVGALVDQHRGGRVDATYPLFALLCSELWFRRFIDSTPPALIPQKGTQRVPVAPELRRVEGAAASGES